MLSMKPPLGTTTRRHRSHRERPCCCNCEAAQLFQNGDHQFPDERMISNSWRVSFCLMFAQRCIHLFGQIAAWLTCRYSYSKKILCRRGLVNPLEFIPADAGPESMATQSKNGRGPRLHSIESILWDQTSCSSARSTLCHL